MEELKIEEKYIFVFVGLPARGKSYFSRKLAKYLNWIGYNSKVFSIGLYRRILIGINYDWKFFEDNNEETLILREKCVDKAIDDMIDYLLHKGGTVGIIDGTNTRSDRRRSIVAYLEKNIPSNVKYNFMWIESICTLEKVIQRNIIKTKLTSPDYKDWNKEKAVGDFVQRIKTYEKVYDHLSPELDGINSTYIQLINQNTEIKLQNVKGFLQSKILSFLVNLISGDKPIYFTRHGESLDNLKNVVGGDSVLSEYGIKFSDALYNYIKKERETWNSDQLESTEKKDKLIIYTSTLKRTISTAEKLVQFGKHFTFKCLDEINSGICDGMSYKEIQEKFPKEYEERYKDKLNYQFPRGESYKDLINRIEPIIYEIERRKGPVLVIGHQATLRCLYGYFTQPNLEQIPYLDMPLHTVIKFMPESYGFNEDRFSINPETGVVTQIEKDKLNKFDDTLYNIPVKSDL